MMTRNLFKTPKKIQVQGLREEINPRINLRKRTPPKSRWHPSNFPDPKNAYDCLTNKKHQERFSVVTGNYYRNSDGHNLGFGGNQKASRKSLTFARRGGSTKGGGWFWR